MRLKTLLIILASFSLFFAAPAGAFTLADSSAASYTQALANYLERVSAATGNSDRVLTGQHITIRDNRVAIKYDETVTAMNVAIGKTPAVLGYGLSHPSVIDETPASSTVMQQIVTAHAAGHIIEIYGSLYNPITGNWSDTPLPVDKTIADLLPGGDNYSDFTDMLDWAAKYLLYLQTQQIAVIWRPFHEVNNGLRWWGRHELTGVWPTKWEFVQLWIAAFNYLTTTKGLHNLIWCYSPVDSSGLRWSTDTMHKGFSYYYHMSPPAEEESLDDYVDMIGVQSYMEDSVEVWSFEDRSMGDQGLPIVYSEESCTAIGGNNEDDIYLYDDFYVTRGKLLSVTEFGSAPAHAEGYGIFDNRELVRSEVKGYLNRLAYWMVWSGPVGLRRMCTPECQYYGYPYWCCTGNEQGSCTSGGYCVRPYPYMANPYYAELFADDWIIHKDEIAICVPAKPSITDPTPDPPETGVPLYEPADSSAFADESGCSTSHISSDWEVDTINTFVSPDRSTYGNTTTGCTNGDYTCWTPPAGWLPNAGQYIRVRHNNANGSSLWSDPVYFETEGGPIPSGTIALLITGDNNTFLWNIINGQAEESTGIKIASGATGNKFYNGTIVNCGANGIDVDENVIIKNTILHNNAGPDIDIATGKTVTASNNSIQDSAKTGDGTYDSSTSDFSTSEVFYDFGIDYRLRRSSYGVNRGTSTIYNSVHEDIMGKNVTDAFGDPVSGVEIDIGAAESDPFLTHGPMTMGLGMGFN